MIVGGTNMAHIFDYSYENIEGFIIYSDKFCGAKSTSVRLDKVGGRGVVQTHKYLCHFCNIDSKSVILAGYYSIVDRLVKICGISVSVGPHDLCAMEKLRANLEGKTLSAWQSRFLECGEKFLSGKISGNEFMRHYAAAPFSKGR
jgi:hypothetical protein